MAELVDEGLGGLGVPELEADGDVRVAKSVEPLTPSGRAALDQLDTICGTGDDGPFRLLLAPAGP